MKSEKLLHQSKTVQGIIISVLPVLALLGMEISTGDINSLFENIEIIIAAVVSIIGGARGIYGRIKANTKIKL